jgi:soluble lytic murein transglycosylase-like protein
MGPDEIVFWGRAIKKAANKNGVSPSLLAALVAQESKFRGHLVSGAGAKGASQVMPLWTQSLCKGVDLMEIESNLNCGAAVLAQYIKEGKSVPAGLRRYVAGPNGEAKAQWYSDQILARLMVASSAVCKANSNLLVAEVPK